MRVTILGSGSSGGTPRIGRGWGACDPTEPKNRRLRASILVENDDTVVLVDASPDLRQQILAIGIEKFDAILFTHAHADHLHGIDDLRGINRAMGAPLDAYADANTLNTIRSRFSYVLEPLDEAATFYYKPVLIPHEIAGGADFDIGTISFRAFDQDHGRTRTLGFQFGPFAYSTDVVNLPETAFDAIAGVDTWIIGTLTDVAHPTHAHVDKALGWIERVRPRRAVLSHLSADLDYGTLAGSLPDGVEPAYDGMVIDIPEAAAS